MARRGRVPAAHGSGKARVLGAVRDAGVVLGMAEFTSFEDTYMPAEAIEKNWLAAGKRILATDPTFGNVILPREFDGLADAIKTMKDLKEARKCIEDMDFLKDCLDHADRFGEFAKQYCVMEARMYLNIVDVFRNDRDGYYEITNMQRNLVLWLRDKDEEERAIILGKCAEGRRILAIYKDEQKIKRLMNKMGEYRDVSDHIIQEASENGRTTLSVERFYDMFPARIKPSKDDIRAYTERTRDELLRMGAVGLGDGKGTYIVPSRAERDEVIRAIMTRLDSIVFDIRRLRELCDKAGVVFPEPKLREIKAEMDRLAVRRTAE